MYTASVIVPFYNPPKDVFITCLEYLKKLDLLEILLIDDCSNDKDVVSIAKQSGLEYHKTDFQSGHDGVPFNLGVKLAKGEYVCKVDADDFLIELPKTIKADFHLAKMNRSADPSNLSLERLILSPRSIHNGALVPKKLMDKIPFEKDSVFFNDVLAIQRLLYRGHSFSVHPSINYIYNYIPNSIQTKKTKEYHRLSNIQTVARFCQLENVPLKKAESFLNLAMLNIKYGASAQKILKERKK